MTASTPDPAAGSVGASSCPSDGIAHRSRWRDDQLHILLVEDDSAVRGVVTRVLKKMGHIVCGCANAATALEAAPFDIAIVDLNLDGFVDGLRLIEQLGHREPEAEYVLTSGSRPVLPPREEGGPYFLRKPFTRNDLSEMIARIRVEALAR